MLSIKNIMNVGKLLNVVTDGNRKLINNEEYRFMIWNIPAIKTCPGATKHCKAKCYARKSEKAYKDVLPFRHNNLNETRADDFSENMIFTIHMLLESRMYKGKIALFRIHESGDFYSQKYFDAWLKIAKHFRGYPIVFTAYTKSVWFIHDLPSNFVVRYSIWDDTNPDDIQMAIDKKLPVYTAAELDDAAAKKLGKSYCECKDCGTCRKCYSRRIKKLVCNIH